MTPEQNAIIERFQQSAPVDVTKLAEVLGLNVWEDDSLPEGISGKLFKDPIKGGPEGYSITVRASDAYVRKRFTVAHEIAHFILHRNLIGTSLTDDAFYRSDLSSWEEAEANRFAADILMPRPLLGKYIKMYGSDPELLAEMLKVSQAAARIRLGLPINTSAPV